MGGVLDQDRHELAGRVTGEPGMRLPHHTLHHSGVQHAELRRQSLHHMGNRSAFSTGGRHQLPAWTDRQGPVNPASGDSAQRQNTRSDHSDTG